MEPVESSLLERDAQGRFPLVELELSLIDPPAERLRFGYNADKLRELEDSIPVHGLLQPAGVRRCGDRYEVVWGDHRTEALRRLGRRRAEFFLVEADADAAVILSAVENLRRHDMSAVEEAALCERLYKALGLDVDVVASRLKCTRSWVERRLRILRWPAYIQKAVHDGQISTGAGAELAGVTDDVHRRFLLGHAVEGGATERTCQAWRIAWLQTGTVPDPTVTQVGPGRTVPAPVEAELPCYLCGDRVGYAKLTHVWLEAECFELFQEFARAWREAPRAGAVPEGPGTAAG
jgi:ParB family chromosome partitioning protein